MLPKEIRTREHALETRMFFKLERVGMKRSGYE